MEQPDASRRAQLLCWAGIGFFYGLFGIIFVPLSRVMPPPPPGAGTAQAVGFVDDHRVGIQAGFAVLMVAIGLFSLFSGLVALHIRRMSVSPAFAYTWIGTLAVGALPGCLIPSFFFLTAAFRPDRDPELIHLLYDLCLLFYVGSLGRFSAQYLAFAIAILLDRNEVFPRWLAYVTIWQIVTELLAGPVFIFRDGPLAWDGVISFWMGTGIFGVWLASVLLLLRRIVAQAPAPRLSGAGG